MLGTGAGAAYGAFSSTDSATSTVGVGSARTVTVATAGTPASPPLPGGTGDVVFSVTNPNDYPVSLMSVTPNGAITPDSAHSGCTTTDGNPVVILAVPAVDLPIPIAGDASGLTVHLAGAATMDTAATSNCQGATFSIPIAITVHTS